MPKELSSRRHLLCVNDLYPWASTDVVARKEILVIISVQKVTSFSLWAVKKAILQPATTIAFLDGFSTALVTHLKNCTVSIDDLQCIFEAFPRQLNALPLSCISSFRYHLKSLLRKEIKKNMGDYSVINERETKWKEIRMGGWIDWLKDVVYKTYRCICVKQLYRLACLTYEQMSKTAYLHRK